jgi:NADH-quinone oxidoreductase subunit I
LAAAGRRFAFRRNQRGSDDVNRSPHRNIYQALKTILIGMRITLQYCFARTVTVQYPDQPPVIQPRFRGFHWYEIEKCSACKACARACPVDCIYVENSGPRKIDKASGGVRGGAMLRYAIDYSKCMFCGLCCDPCPTKCLHMGEIHDLSGYGRRDVVVEFTELARQGLRTPMPVWLKKSRLPAWAQARKDASAALSGDRTVEMANALKEQPVAKPAPAAPAAEAPSAGPKPAGPAEGDVKSSGPP